MNRLKALRYRPYGDVFCKEGVSSVTFYITLQDRGLPGFLEIHNKLYIFRGEKRSQ